MLGAAVEVDGSQAAFATVRGPTADADRLAFELAERLSAGKRSPRTGGVGAPGPRVLVTRPADQAAPVVDALRARGFDPVVVPAIEIRREPDGGPLDEAAATLDRYGWV